MHMFYGRVPNFNFKFSNITVAIYKNKFDVGGAQTNEKPE